MKKKQFMFMSLAAVAAASCMTSCIENEEGSGLSQLRKDLGNKYVAEGEAAKINANANLTVAQATAKLTEAQAATEQAVAAQEQAKVAGVAAESKLKELAAAYKEETDKLALALAQATNEKEIADVKYAMAEAEVKHNAAMATAEAAKVAAEQALAKAKKDAEAAAIGYEALIIKAEENLATAKKDNAVAMEAIRKALADLEITKFKNETALMTAQQAADKERVAAELAEISTAITNYETILKAVNDAFDTYAAAEKTLIDKHAAYAKAVDTYNDAEITNAAAKAAKILKANQDIEDAEVAVAAKERAVAIAEIGVDYAKANLADFQKIEKEDKEAVVEALDAVKQDIQDLKLLEKQYDQQIAAIEGTELAQAKDALKAAKDASDKKFDEKVKELASKIYALDDAQAVAGQWGVEDAAAVATIQESTYSEKEVVAQAEKDAKAKAYAELVKTNAEKGSVLVEGAAQEADGSLTAEIKKLNANKQETMDNLKETAAYVAAFDALQKWNDTPVKSFAITIGEDILADFIDTEKSPAEGWLTTSGSQDVNGVSLYKIDGGKISLDDAYAAWLCNSMLTTSGAYEYNYRIDKTVEVLNNYLNANGIETEIKLTRNNWTNDVNSENPIYKLDQFIDTKHASYESARNTAIINLGLDPSTAKAKDIQDQIKIEQDNMKNIKEAQPDSYQDDSSYKASQKKVSDYNINNNKMLAFKAMSDEIEALRKIANDEKTKLATAVAEADTDLGIAYKNATDKTRAEISAAEAKKAANMVAYQKAVKEATDTKTAAEKEISDKVAELKKDIATEELNKSIAYKDLKEYAAVKAVEEKIADLKDEKNTKATQPKTYKQALADSYKKIESSYTSAEETAKAIANEEEALVAAIETAEKAVVTAERAVVTAEVAVDDAKDTLAKIENDTYDAQAEAEDTLAKAKLDLEMAEKDAADAKAKYEAAVALYDEYQKAE